VVGWPSESESDYLTTALRHGDGSGERIPG
jgi:hypothetical protein